MQISNNLINELSNNNLEIINKDYSFLRIEIDSHQSNYNFNLDQDLHNEYNFSILGIEFPDSPKIKKNFYIDPIFYLILRELLKDLQSLNIISSDDLLIKLQLSFEKNQFDSFEIFREIIRLIKENSLCINNINIFIMAQKPRLRTKDVNSKNLIKANLIKIFENQFGNDLNLFLKNVSIHAGTGENVGSVGKNLAIDAHVMTHIVRREDNKSRFIGYGFDRHQIIDFKHKSYKNELNFNILGCEKFFLKNSLQVKAHSDGDLILHAICNSIFSAIGEGDIGDFFCDKEKNNYNRDSFEFALYAMQMIQKYKMKISKIILKLMVSFAIFDDLINQNAYYLILEKLSQKLNINKNCIQFLIIPIPSDDKKNFRGCVSRSEAIEVQSIIFLEQYN